MEKLCKGCNLVKESKDFSVRQNGKLLYFCKICSNSRAKLAYKNRKEKTKKRATVYKHVLCSIINEIKMLFGCCFCEEKEPICLDFHHKDPHNKSDEVSDLIRRKMKKETFDEISKCIIVCSNCHRKIHANIISCEEKLTCKIDINDYFEKVGNRLLLKKSLKLKYNLKTEKIYICNCGNRMSRNSKRCKNCVLIKQ